MPRVKGGNVARKRRKKILKLAKGYFGSKHILYKTAHEQVMKSLAYGYRDRKQRKRDFRKLWIARINAASRLNGLSYSRLVNGLNLAGVQVNRKMLADIAVNDPQGFTVIVETAKKGLNGESKPVTMENVVKSVKSMPQQETLKEETIKKETVKKETVKKETVKPEPKEATKAQEVALSDMTVAELKSLCKERGIQGYSALKKAELIELLST